MSFSIWNHFTKDSSSRRVTCNLCSSSFGYTRGANLNLWRHLESKHGEDRFSDLVDKISHLVSVDSSILRYIDQPEFHALFPPFTRIPTRYHLMKNVMPARVESLRENIRQRLTGQRVSLCIDQWTIKGGRMTLSCFNANFINEKGELENLLLPVSPLDGRPNPDNLRSQIVDVIDKYELEVVAVVTLRKTVKDMGLLNLHCAAHQLHLVVSNAMNEWTFVPEMDEINNFAKELNHSSKMRTQYFKFCADSGIELVGVPEWDGTRWGSLFHTLKMTVQQWTAVNATRKFAGKSPFTEECRVVLIKVVDLLQPFNEYTVKMCSSCLITEAAFIFSEITYILRKRIGEDTDGSCSSIALANLLLAQMEKRTAYYTESEEMKKLLFFDPRAVEVFPHDWKSIGSIIMASSSPITKPSAYSWCKKNLKRSETPIEDEIDKYISGCNRGVTQTTNPLEFWKSNRCIYPNLAEMALKSLPIPATSVSAQRVFIAAGLLDKELHRSEEKIHESTLLLRLNNIGNRAREISCQPPLSLVLQSEYSDNDPSTTFGYVSDESDFEESAENDEEDEF